MNIMHPRTAINSPETGTSTTEDKKNQEVINTIGDDKIASAINNEVDKILGPTLERTKSGCDLKIIAPLRHKKREYRSQEALPFEDSLTASTNHSIVNVLPSQIEVQINDLHNTDKLKVPRVSILHENQRAEIVAAVTERLYSKLKKKEEVAVSKIESIVDRKIVEPLNELKICTNARQRLIELSQKAIRNKRKISVPAHTQTRVSVTRVKDQGIDVQSDLEIYSVKNSIFYIHKRDASTETLPMTPRYKEIGVGPKYGSLNCSDRSTITDAKQYDFKNFCMMTESVTKNECFTQTQVVPPPRRRKRGSKKALRSNNQNDGVNLISSSPTISINISQTYPIDSESQNSEDNSIHVSYKNDTGNITGTPDLLTNYTHDTNENEIEYIAKSDKEQVKDNKMTVDNIMCLGLKHDSEDFSDHEDCSLPRVIPDSLKKNIGSDIKEIILGRNKNMYPYNIVLSPAKERDHSKRIVTFKDENYGNNVIAQSSCNYENDLNALERFCFTPDQNLSQKHFSGDYDNNYRSETLSLSDSCDSEKSETDSFVWKKDISENKTLGYSKRSYVPVHKGHSARRTGRKLLKDIMSSDSTDKSHGSHNISKLRTRERFLGNRSINHVDSEFESIQKNIFDACNELELSVNRYNTYIETSSSKINDNKNNILLRTPTKYLQHLIRIRREMVKIEQIDTKGPFYDLQN